MIEALRKKVWQNPVAPRAFDLFALPSRHTAALLRKQLADLPAGSRMLDAGMGTGLVGPSVAQALDFKLSGFDSSQEMLELARERAPGAEIHEGTLLEIPFERNAFDVVLVNHVLKYVDASDMENVVREIDRVAAPASTISVSDLLLPRFRPPFVGPQEFLNNKVLGMWTRRAEFLQAMGDRGFSLERTSYPLASFMWLFRR